MAEAATVTTKSHSQQQRKRKRLNAVLDKLTSHISAKTSVDDDNRTDNNHTQHNNHGNNNLEDTDRMFGRTEQHFAGSGSSGGDEQEASTTPAGPGNPEGLGRKQSNAALRRELWRDNQQQSVEDHRDTFPQQRTAIGQDVFKFDSFDRDRYLAGQVPPPHHASMPTSQRATIVASAAENHAHIAQQVTTQPSLQPAVPLVQAPDLIDMPVEDVFSPASGRSPHSSLSSPQVSVDSPRICFSPLRIKDSIEEEDAAAGHVIHTLPKLSVRGCDSPGAPQAATGTGGASGGGGWLDPAPQHKLMPGLASLSRPISPNPSITPTTPISPCTPLHALRHLPTYLTEVYRRRCLSDTDLSSSWEELARGKADPRGTTRECVSLIRQRHLPLSSKGGSLESETSSTTTQESPLDLSVRSSVSSTTGIAIRSTLAASMDNIQAKPPLLAGKGRSRSSTSRGERERYPDRFSLDRLDVEPAAGAPSSASAATSADVAYVCPICGQMFSLHDRLAKHMASRHKSRSTDSGSKAYLCDVCRRSFARSDMLTRHMRLHTGIKPYTCRVCGQVFSRSDHLSTHQRTHTGEKPYRCPSCPYAACRRDMITRHMRTHARYELQESTSIEEGVSFEGGGESPRGPSRSVSSESGDPPGTGQPQLQRQQPLTKPPSPMDTEEQSLMTKEAL